MKNTLSIALLALIALTGTALTACKKTSAPVVQENEIKMPFATKVDGVYFVDSMAMGVLSNDTIVITADSIGQQFILRIPADATEDMVYSMNVGEPCSFFYSFDDFATVFGNVTGSLKITRHDPVDQEIEGIFTIIATRPVPAETINITEGEFNIVYL